MSETSNASSATETATAASSPTTATATAPESTTTPAPARKTSAQSAVDQAVEAAVQTAVAALEARCAELERLNGLLTEQVAAQAAALSPATTSSTPTTGTVTVTNSTGYPLLATTGTRTKPTSTFRFERGTTTRVPAAFWAEWSAANSGAPFVASGAVTAAPDTTSSS